MANESIYAAFERMWQHIMTKLNEATQFKTLTFTGAVEATYDGSGAVTVSIPAPVSDEHINDLIADALAAIPNAAEVAY